MVIENLSSIDTAALARFDDVIDVRSPGEFALDHLPGAINLPVLSNDERALVGTLYVQDSRFRARRIGAALVARNVARHLEGPLQDRPGSWAPLIYCWRGGQRSNAMATILSQVGWRVTLLEGGYRTWRRHVTAALYDGEPKWRVALLDGYTGSAKTDILNRVGALGVQALDLEGLAAHRGSLFGAIPSAPQPSQKLFESRLLAALETLDPARPVLVEAESSKIGQRMIPPALWRAMEVAPSIDLAADRGARIAYLVETYADMVADAERLAGILADLPGRHGAKQRAVWQAMAQVGDFHGLADALIEAHSDPAYERGRRRAARPTLGLIVLPDLGLAERDEAARMIARITRDWETRL